MSFYHHWIEWIFSNANFVYLVSISGNTFALFFFKISMFCFKAVLGMNYEKHWFVKNGPKCIHKWVIWFLFQEVRENGWYIKLNNLYAACFFTQLSQKTHVSYMKRHLGRKLWESSENSFSSQVLQLSISAKNFRQFLQCLLFTFSSCKQCKKSNFYRQLFDLTSKLFVFWVF